MRRARRKNGILKHIIGVAIFFISIFFGPSFVEPDFTQENTYILKLEDVEIGRVENEADGERLLQIAKERISSYTDEITYFDVTLTVEGTHEFFADYTDEDEVVSNFILQLPDYMEETLERCYTLKVGDYLVVLSSIVEVQETLQAAIDLYDLDGDFEVQLQQDDSRGFSVLTASITAKRVEEDATIDRGQAGFTVLEEELFSKASYLEELSFNDFDYGIYEMWFDDTVEIMECYLNPDEISTVEYAIEEITKENDEDVIYTVESGDTLSYITIVTGVPMEDIIAMNDALESEYSTIRIDQELIVTVPKPTLTIGYMATVYEEEEYSAAVIYVDNDDWYTTDQVTLQEPSTGFRKATSNITYYNGEIYVEEVLKEDVLMEAVPKIVEKGTQIPPTYIKPLYGGTFSSGFGYRSFNGGGYHYGVDWAVPTGSSVLASCGGVVTRSGWSSSYGYCIYITHPDGKETRYAHNSKLYVSVGDTVYQGQVIALSGNTGNSFGAHLHFEIRINGVAVNPLEYIQ
ncbi:MAG: M23 family metallopeptidase [Lachnospiraceae bacterium]